MAQFKKGFRRYCRGYLTANFSVVAAAGIYGAYALSLGAIPLYIGLKSDFHFVTQIASIPYRMLHDGVKDMGLGLKMMGHVYPEGDSRYKPSFRYMKKLPKS
jgi:outer membrane scaffolding protein for murein synthesis (MipA/OmpV family)